MWAQKNYAGPERRKESEQLFNELEQLLRRCISSLAMLAENSPYVNKAHLHSLRSVLKDDGDGVDLLDIKTSLQQLADDIASSIKVAESHSQSPSSAQKIPALKQVVLELIEKLDLPDEMNEAGNVLKQRIKKRFNIDELPEVLKRITTLIVQLRAHLDQERLGKDSGHQAQRQVKVLTSRLQTLEAETSDLRKRVAHEHSQALHDSLTGLNNRRAYKERMLLEFARWQRYDSPLVLLIWDIDRFKVINDTYGHKAGDKALVTIAHLLGDQIRATDFIARYGGEEFVILMPQTLQHAATRVAETLRNSVAACNFHFRGTLAPITISCGGAQIYQGDTPEKLFERADAALYEVKKLGGNRCIFASAPALVN